MKLSQKWVGTLSQLTVVKYMRMYTEVKCMDELCTTQATGMTSSVAGQCLPYKILKTPCVDISFVGMYSHAVSLTGHSQVHVTINCL